MNAENEKLKRLSRRDLNERANVIESILKDLPVNEFKQIETPNAKSFIVTLRRIGYKDFPTKEFSIRTITETKIRVYRVS